MKFDKKIHDVNKINFKNIFFVMISNIKNIKKFRRILTLNLNLKPFHYNFTTKKRNHHYFSKMK